MTWNPTTDDEFGPNAVNAADKVYDWMWEWGAGQSELTGRDDDDRAIFTVAVSQEPNAPSSVVAIHIDWREQTVTTAWRERDRPYDPDGEEG